MILAWNHGHDPALALSGAGSFAAPEKHGYPGAIAASTPRRSPSAA
jgi:hypothetical protein